MASSGDNGSSIQLEHKFVQGWLRGQRDELGSEGCWSPGQGGCTVYMQVGKPCMSGGFARLDD